MIFTEEQVKEKLAIFIEKYKAGQSNVKLPTIIDQITGKKTEALKPEYWAGYNKAVRQLNQISVHFNKGNFPEWVFNKRAPNQTPDEEVYIRDNFKSVTLGTGRDFVNTLMRGLNRNNWQLTFQESAKDFKKYVEEDVPVFGSIHAFWEKLVVGIFLQDANGLFVMRPEKMGYLKNEDGEVILDEEGFATINNDEIKPVPYYFSTPNIVGQQLFEWYLCMTPEKSVVKSKNKLVREGIVLELYDQNTIWRIEQKGNKVDYEFDVFAYYPHNQNYLPIKIGGDAVFSPEEGLLFNSIFYSVVDILDEVLIDHMMLFLIKKKSGFPLRVAISDKCTAEKYGSRCSNGKIWNSDKGVGEVCSNCGGKGSISRVTAGGDILIHPGDGSLNDGDQGIKGDYVKYVSPDVTTLEFLREEKKIATEEARRQMHLRSANQQATGAVDSATGVLDEMKAMTAFVTPPILQLFAILRHFLEGVRKLKYAGAEIEYELTEPSDFDVATPQEYLDAIQKAREAGSPSIIIQQLMMMYLNSVEFPDFATESAYKLILKSDDLFALTSEQIAMDSAIYHKWQRYLHNSAIQLVGLLYDDNPKFFDLDIKEQRLQLIELAKGSVPKESENVNVDEIMNLANQGE